MSHHDFDTLRAVKRRVGAAYTKACNITGGANRVLDRMFANALRSCVGATPASQAKILAGYAARFERIADL